MVSKRRREVASNDNLCFLLLDVYYVPEILDLLASCACCKNYLAATACRLGSRERQSEKRERRARSVSRVTDLHRRTIEFAIVPPLNGNVTRK